LGLVLRLLEVRGVSKRFGGLVALHGVDLHVNYGEIVGLVGPNGAGKTTLLNVISGIYRPDGGRVYLHGREITGLPPEAVCRLGVGRTFQSSQLFPNMTVLENVVVGAVFGSGRGGFPLGDWRCGDVLEFALDALEFVGLADKAESPARELNAVEARRLEVARALATRPRLLLLDEATAGLTPKECLDAMRLIERVRERGISVLMVEHVMKIIMGVSDRIVVLHHGRKIADGPPKLVAEDERVINAYLGERFIL